jgi:hypothetical protein
MRRSYRRARFAATNLSLDPVARVGSGAAVEPAMARTASGNHPYRRPAPGTRHPDQSIQSPRERCQSSIDCSE